MGKGKGPHVVWEGEKSFHKSLEGSYWMYYQVWSNGRCIMVQTFTDGRERQTDWLMPPEWGEYNESESD